MHSKLRFQCRRFCCTSPRLSDLQHRKSQKEVLQFNYVTVSKGPPQDTRTNTHEDKNRARESESGGFVVSDEHCDRLSFVFVPHFVAVWIFVSIRKTLSLRNFCFKVAEPFPLTVKAFNSKYVRIWEYLLWKSILRASLKRSFGCCSASSISIRVSNQPTIDPGVPVRMCGACVLKTPLYHGRSRETHAAAVVLNWTSCRLSGKRLRLQSIRSGPGSPAHHTKCARSEQLTDTCETWDLSLGSVCPCETHSSWAHQHWHCRPLSTRAAVQKQLPAQPLDCAGWQLDASHANVHADRTILW